jgi:hypothetical protein
VTITIADFMTTAASDRQKASTRWLIIFWSIVVLGGILRFYALGRIPAGLNGDEAEEGVEAISLIATSMDRWGNRFPVFFPHVGSGMNALYTYLTLPLFYYFGPSVAVLRVVSATLGFLTLFTTYFIGKINFDRNTGLLAMLLVAVLPWHFMISRWGIEWSILPFWFSLGIVTFGMALRSETSSLWKLVVLLPWAIGIYSYFASAIPVAAISLLTVVAFRRTILQQWQWWLAGLVVAFVADIPIIFFVCVNFLKLTFPLHLGLPFSIPILPVSRLSEIGEPFVPQLIKNITFIVSGYRDGLVWNHSLNFPPLTGAAPVITLIGIVAMTGSAIRNRRPSFLLNILLVSVLSVLTIRLNINRFNWFFIPSIVACAGSMVRFYRHQAAPLIKKSLVIGSGLYLSLFLAMFYLNYFSQFNTEILSEDVALRNGFRVGLDDALHSAVGLAAADETIYVEAGKSHPYLYVIFYGLADIRSFQTTRRMRTAADGLYHVAAFDRFVFGPDGAPPDTAFIFVTRPDRLPCDGAEVLKPGPLWAVGRCHVNGAATNR